MTVAAFTVTLSIPHANSLKDKRMVLRSILSKVRGQLNVSAAEVDDQDCHRSAVLGFAYLAANQSQSDAIGEKLLDFLEQQAIRQSCEITGIAKELY